MTDWTPNAEPDLAPGTAMQKVLPPDQVRRYLDEGCVTVSGDVHRFADVESLRTASQIVTGLRLNYRGSPFSRRDKQVWLIRWRPDRTDMFRPSRGTGAGRRSSPIPTWETAATQVTAGAELYRIDRRGRGDLIAVHHPPTAGWIRVARG
jgi:hypothetical protein